MATSGSGVRTLARSTDLRFTPARAESPGDTVTIEAEGDEHGRLSRRWWRGGPRHPRAARHDRTVVSRGRAPDNLRACSVSSSKHSFGRYGGPRMIRLAPRAAGPARAGVSRPG